MAVHYPGRGTHDQKPGSLDIKGAAENPGRTSGGCKRDSDSELPRRHIQSTSLHRRWVGCRLGGTVDKDQKEEFKTTEIGKAGVGGSLLNLHAEFACRVRNGSTALDGRLFVGIMERIALKNSAGYPLLQSGFMYDRNTKLTFCKKLNSSV